jgi:hypothetical protein
MGDNTDSDWAEGSVRLMQKDRQGVPAFLGGAIDLCAAVRHLHELVGAPTFVWAEQRVAAHWARIGSDSSWRDVIAQHLPECAGCADFIYTKMKNDRAFLRLLETPQPAMPDPARPFTPTPAQIAVLARAGESTWRAIEMALADALFLWRQAGNGDAPYARRIENLWLELFGDPTSSVDVEQQRAELAHTILKATGILPDEEIELNQTDDPPVCEGHESLRGDSMGSSVYCDGSCVG